MSENGSSYCPSPGHVWKVNTANRTPIFLSQGSRFDIIEKPANEFKMILPGNIEVPLQFKEFNLFMNAPGFSLEEGSTITTFMINFKLAPPNSVGRGVKTLYCTVQTQVVDEAGAIQDSEQGVFGAEEDGGGLEEEPVASL